MARNPNQTAQGEHEEDHSHERTHEEGRTEDRKLMSHNPPLHHRRALWQVQGTSLRSIRRWLIC